MLVNWLITNLSQDRPIPPMTNRVLSKEPASPVDGGVTAAMITNHNAKGN